MNAGRSFSLQSARRGAVVAAGATLLLAVVAGWLVLSPATRTDARAIAPAAPDANGSGLLDGMAFTGLLGPVDAARDVPDRLVFADGMFVSEECARRCDYPPAPYFTRRNGDAIEFVSETRCLSSNAKIVWRGTVRDGRLEGRFSWTAERWYWTVEVDFAFAGALDEGGTPAARNP